MSERSEVVAPVDEPNTRVDLLERVAVDVARAWAADRRAELVREGRSVEDGWPGTVSEARSRVYAEAAQTLARHAMTALTHVERDKLARDTYEEARRSWGAFSRGAVKHSRRRS
jgi:hypothetical protein